MIKFKYKHDSNSPELEIEEQEDGRIHGFMDSILIYDISVDEEPWNDEMRGIQSGVKERKKGVKKAVNTALMNKLTSLGEDAGTRDYRFRIDNRLYYALKANGCNITQFINSAIVEKLEGMK